MEAARKGLGRGCTAKMNDRGELLLLLLVGGPVWSACENRRNLAVQKRRCKLDSVARHDASIKPIEPAAVLHDSVLADAISSCFGEGCVGHLVHADGARGGLIDRERIPSQAPPPIGSCCRIARTLDLRQGGEQLGRDGGRGILAKETARTVAAMTTIRIADGAAFSLCHAQRARLRQDRNPTKKSVQSRQIRVSGNGTAHPVTRLVGPRFPSTPDPTRSQNLQRRALQPLWRRGTRRMRTL